jgi:hypothetical protein
LDAVFFSGWVSFAVRKGMPSYINHIIEGDGANISADSISNTGVPVYRRGGSMYSKFGWGFDGSPDFVSVMFAYDLAFILKIRIYWQNNSSIRLH